jgi:hypothetical protein
MNATVLRWGRIAAVLVAVLALCAQARALDIAAPPPDPQLNAIARELAVEIRRIDAYLAYYDQINRLEIMWQRMTPEQADAMLRATAQQLFVNSFSDQDFVTLIGYHRQAFANFVAGLSRQVETAAHWPAGRPPQVYLTRSRKQLAALWADYERRIGQGADTLPPLLAAGEVQAWTSGYPHAPDAHNPLLGQPQRIEAALPPIARQIARSAR